MKTPIIAGDPTKRFHVPWLAFIALFLSQACNDRGIPTETEAPPAIEPVAAPPAPPAPGTPSDAPSDGPSAAPSVARRRITVGEAVSGTIRPDNETCSFWLDLDGWEGICNSFEISAPSSGTLKITVRWAGDVPLALFAKTSNDAQIALVCCGAPIAMELPVDSGYVYHLELAYVGRPSGYPNVPPVDYTMDVTLLPSDAQSSRILSPVAKFDEVTRPESARRPQ